MKTIIKKFDKRYLTIWIFLITAITFSQNTTKTDRLLFNSFSITPLEIFVTENNTGASITGEISCAINNNVFTFSGTTGGTFSIWGLGKEFNQLNILYGREFEVLRKLYIDTHAGLGVLIVNYSRHPNLTKVGIPIILKVRYKTGNKFSIGIRSQVNINEIENISSVGLLLQWNYL